MKRERVIFNSFSLPEGDRYALKPIPQDALVATKSEYCRCRDGKLLGPIGQEYLLDSGDNYLIANKNFKMKNVMLLNTAVTDFVYKRNAIFIEENGRLWIYIDSMGVRNFASCKPPYAICRFPASSSNGDGGVAIASALGILVVSHTGGTMYKLDEPTNAAVCWFAGRVFYSKGYNVYYSEMGNVRDFTESAYGGGYINVAGSGEGVVLQLLPYRDGILLFYERGIAMLHAKGAASDFRLERLDYCGVPIAIGSGAVCGRYALFTTEEGDVYRLDGTRFERLAAGLPLSLRADRLNTASDGERYYRSDGERMLVMEASDGSSYFSYPVSGLTDADSAALGVQGEYLVRMSTIASYPARAEPKFYSERLRLRDSKEKTITKVTVYGEGKARVSLRGDGDTTEEVLALTSAGVAFEPFVRGQEFDLQVNLTFRAKVTRIEFEFEYVGGAK